MVTYSRKILIVDDEVQILKVLKAYLEKEGYRVVTAQDGNAAISVFDLESPDFVILDLNLPGKDGVDVCTEIRKESSVPILMLTARVDEDDKLTGLDLGADDYVTKPFSPREIVARVRTILRRVNSGNQQDEVIRTAGLVIDLAQHVVTSNDIPVVLTPTEFDILVFLARNPKRVFSRLQILEKVQGNAFEGYERTVDAHIKNLRTKLHIDPMRPEYIHTVFGVGYKFETGIHEE